MSVQTAIRLDPDVLAQLKELAKDGRPMVWHIRKAISNYLEGVKGTAPKPTKSPTPKPNVVDAYKTVTVKAFPQGAQDVIDYLNMKAGTRYKYSEASIKDVRARLNSGFTLEDCKTVIDKKCAEWLGTDMAKYLRPQTLFQASKFEGYLNQLATKSQINAQEVDDWVNGNTPSIFGEVYDHE